MWVPAPLRALLRPWRCGLSERVLIRTLRECARAKALMQRIFGVTDGRGWCCERGLNSRPLPYQGSALPLSYHSIVRGALDRVRSGRKREAAKILPIVAFRHSMPIPPPGRCRRWTEACKTVNRGHDENTPRSQGRHDTRSAAQGGASGQSGPPQGAGPRACR